MESHIRIKFKANLAALQQLKCSVYKVLMLLANRTSRIGTCYPSCESIAMDCDLHVKTVYKAIETLIELGYVGIVRNAFYDELYGKNMPTLYQVSPFFMEIEDEKSEQALILWSTIMESKLHINQQQEPTALTNRINQPQETTTTKDNRDFEKETANRKPQNNEVDKPQGSQRSENRKSSAIVKKYTSVILINEPLPDELSEQLAARLLGYKIAIKLGRGLINHFGYNACQSAANYMEFSKQFQVIRNPAGFIRDTLENGVEDYQERVNEYDQYLES